MAGKSRSGAYETGMADYIYLLENRLSPAQRTALRTIRDVARSKALTVFLVGGAVRDLTSGSPVRDLDVVVQGNALKLKKDIEKAGGVITGEHDPGQALYVRFPGNVRMEIGSTLSVSFPQTGQTGGQAVDHPGRSSAARLYGERDGALVERRLVRAVDGSAERRGRY